LQIAVGPTLQDRHALSLAIYHRQCRRKWIQRAVNPVQHDCVPPPLYPGVSHDDHGYINHPHSTRVPTLPTFRPPRSNRRNTLLTIRLISGILHSMCPGAKPPLDITHPRRIPSPNFQSLCWARGAVQVLTWQVVLEILTLRLLHPSAPDIAVTLVDKKMCTVRLSTVTVHRHHHHHHHHQDPLRSFLVFRRCGSLPESSVFRQFQIVLTPVSWWSCWTQMAQGLLHNSHHSAHSRESSLSTLQILGIWLAGVETGIMEMCPRRPSMRLSTILSLCLRTIENIFKRHLDLRLKNWGYL